MVEWITPSWLKTTNDLSCCCIHTIWPCLWSSHTDNPRKCQYGYYNEQTRQWLWFTKMHFVHNKLTIFSKGLQGLLALVYFTHGESIFSKLAVLLPPYLPWVQAVVPVSRSGWCPISKTPQSLVIIIPLVSWFSRDFRECLVSTERSIYKWMSV